MNLRQKILTIVERGLAAALIAILAGSALAFGGAAWWAPPVFGALALALALGALARIGLIGEWRVLKSPLGLLALAAIGLAMAQLFPWPRPLAVMASSQGFVAHDQDVIPSRSALDAPSLSMGPPTISKAPLTLDRASTFRWMIGALACFAVFWSVSQVTDCAQRLWIVWGSLISGFLVCTALAIVQTSGGASGLYGLFQPGSTRSFVPTLADQAESPGFLNFTPAEPRGERIWSLSVPGQRFEFGTMLGGADSYLALASIALPLCLALTLHLIAPRGDNEPLLARLRHSGHGGLAVLVGLLYMIGSLLIGALAGVWLSLPFMLGLILVGIPAARGTGLRWSSLSLLAAGLGLVALGWLWSGYGGLSNAALATSQREGWVTVWAVWGDAIRVWRDFPFFGCGLGGFSALHSFYKTSDAASTTALSSLLQWMAESGLIGVTILAVAAIWSIRRLPWAVRSIGGAERTMAFGLIGSAVAFCVFSAIHWTVELPAVALSASALAGVFHRWLAGGTDLFVVKTV